MKRTETTLNYHNYIEKIDRKYFWIYSLQRYSKVSIIWENNAIKSSPQTDLRYFNIFPGPLRKVEAEASVILQEMFVMFLNLFTTSRNWYSVIHEQSSTVKSLAGDEPTTITRESMEAGSRARGSLHLAPISICQEGESCHSKHVDAGQRIDTATDGGNEAESENRSCPPQLPRAFLPRDQINPRYLRLLSASRGLHATYSGEL